MITIPRLHVHPHHLRPRAWFSDAETLGLCLVRRRLVMSAMWTPSLSLSGCRLQLLLLWFEILTPFLCVIYFIDSSLEILGFFFFCYFDYWVCCFLVIYLVFYCESLDFNVVFDCKISFFILLSDMLLNFD